MDIMSAMKSQGLGLRVVYHEHERWLVYEPASSEWEVYEHKYASSVKCLIRTGSQDEAIDYLVKGVCKR